MANSLEIDEFLDLQEVGCDDDKDPLTYSFDKAANYLQNLLPRVDNQTLLTLYGYYKQGSEGSCTTPKPSWYDMKAKAKWEAWKKLENMPKHEAKILYIETIKLLDPTFDEEMEKQGHGVKVSSMAGDDAVPYSQMGVIDHIKDGHIEEVKKYLEESENVRHVVNKLDKCGLALIHWAADSGHECLLEILLEGGANVNLVDGDGQTPLHYAASCGHLNCVKFLLESGAKTDIADNDGNVPFEVATDDEIKELLK